MFYPASLINKFKMARSTQCTIKDVLSIESIFKLSTYHYEPFVSYCISYSRDILKYSLSKEVSHTVSTNAFSILMCSSCQGMFNELIKNDYFRDIITQSLADPDLPQPFIGKIASLTSACIKSIKSENYNVLGYIYCLLKYCNNNAVYNFFTFICSESDDSFNKNKLHEWLNKMGFSEYLLRELTTIDYNHEIEGENLMKDKVFDNLFCFYELISMCCKEERFKKSFENKEFIDVLINNEFHIKNSILMNKKWKVICGLVSKNTAKYIYEKVYPKAIQILDDEPQILKEYKVTIIDLLAKMMIVYPDIVNDFIDISILQIILNISLNFKNSIFLQDSILKFISSSFVSQEFSSLLITTLMPLFMDYATDRSNRVYSCFCYRAIMIIILKSKNNPNAKKTLNVIYGYDDFVKYQLEPYKKSLETPYGSESKPKIVKVFKNLFE